MNEQDEIRAICRKFVEKFDPVKVYLFGSYAKGTYHEESDFDFYIVVKDDSPNLIDLTAQAYLSIRERERPVDILMGRESNFEKRKFLPTMEKEVFDTGVVLYG